jgi:hypothetical protein
MGDMGVCGGVVLKYLAQDGFHWQALTCAYGFNKDTYLETVLSLLLMSLLIGGEA